LLDSIFIDPLLALGLGLLVGLQKELTASPLAGLKTFGLTTLFGALAAMVSQHTTGWVVPAGLLGVLGVGAVGNWLQARHAYVDPGQTTEVALLVMYLVGALTVLGPRPAAIVLGGAVAVLLHLRDELKGMVARLSDRDVRAIMQFVLVSLVILPILPDRTYGPYDVLNPHNAWLMVVLIVGMNLAGYAAFRLMSRRGGTLVAGVLGGLVSSTATTFAYARQARAGVLGPPVAATIVWIASPVVYVRILIEIGAVAPRFLPVAAAPIVVLSTFVVAGAVVTWPKDPPAGEHALSPGNPSELRPAIVFGVLYAAVLLAVAAAEAHFGSAGLFATALVSGLTDIDAITLSTSRLVADGRLAPGTGWRLIVAASLSNLIFKVGIAWFLGGKKLGIRLGALAGAASAAGVAIITFWP